MKKLLPLAILAMFFSTCAMAQQMNISELKETDGQKSFTSAVISSTPFVCGETQVFDYDGNKYNTIQIGKQCWMKENLKTTHYSDGAYIETASSDISQDENMDLVYNRQYRYSPQNNPYQVASRGYLYNWTAVTRDVRTSSFLNPSGIQGICPTGWHVPSDAEWIELTDFLSSNSQYVCDTKSQHISPDVYNKYIAKSMAATSGWRKSKHKCAVGYQLEENNASGFSALAAGQFTGYENFDYFGEKACFWTCTQQNEASAFYRSLNFDEEFVSGAGLSGPISKRVGCSVRCLKD